MAKLGIAFAGGGVRGASHLGIIQALNEHGIHADMYAGASAGSIVASLLAYGYSPKDALTHFESASKGLVDIAYGHILKGIFTKAYIEGFIKGDNLENLLEQMLSGYSVKDLKIPVAFATTDIDEGYQIIFSNAHNIKPEFVHDRRYTWVHEADYKTSEVVRASSSIPPVFIPKVIDGHKLVDGGVVNNLPSDLLWAMGADRVISLDLGYSGQVKTRGIIDISMTTIDLMMTRVTDNNMQEFGLYLDPQIYDVTVLETSKIQYCFDKGYQYGLAHIPEIVKMLEV